MLGRRDPQRSYFDAQRLPHRVPDDSFYARMGAVIDLLFSDDDLAMMYSADTGRRGLPPSLMCGVMLLQFHDGVSDDEAVQRVLYDLRWKVALHLPLDYAGFDRSSLCNFRKRLLENGKERYAFDRFVAVGREAGFIPDRVTLLTDTTNVKGAGAVQDTYTLLRKGIRKLLRDAGYHVPGKRQRLSTQGKELVARYIDRDRRADIDWSDPDARAAELQALVMDVETALEMVIEQMDDAEVRSTGWLLTKILGDDVVTDDHGNPQIGEGTAPDRIISITDPEMRHGRKSKSKRINGFKVISSMEQESEFLLDIADMTAMGSDGAELMDTIGRVESHAKVTVERVIGDGAFGSGKNRAACANHEPHPVDLVSPVARSRDPGVHKSAFQIDLEARRATCPGGHTVEGRGRSSQDGQPILSFTFPRATCEACPLFSRCVKSKSRGRTVYTHPYEAYLQDARLRQETDDFDELYRPRAAVERKIAELVHHGIRRTRYLGEPKRQLQRLWTGAAVNLKRLFTLTQARSVELRPILCTGRQRAVCAVAA
jgi:transposase